MHYCRWRTRGDVLYPVEAQVHGGSALDRYWAKVDKGGPEVCWPWKGGTQRYGIFWGGDHRPNGSPIMVKAHRWTYEQFVGPIGDLQVLHRCDNPPCVNPSHLFLGTVTDNMRDMVIKGRGASPSPALFAASAHPGETNSQAKVTAEIVRQIRAAHIPYKVSQQSLAEQFGLTQSAVSAIIRRKTWAHIK